VEVITWHTVIEIVKLFGPMGLIAVVWYVDTRNFQKLIEDRRVETNNILTAYRDDIATVKEMYRNNVKLVESYQGVCGDLHDLVVLNVEKLSVMTEKIDQNEFCPLQRLKKSKIEIGG
jgi:hypothetical protein